MTKRTTDNSWDDDYVPEESEALTYLQLSVYSPAESDDDQ